MNANPSNIARLLSARVIVGLVFAGLIPSGINIIEAFIEPHDVITTYYIVYAIMFLIPGFLAISLPCLILIYLGKKSPVWYIGLPSCMAIPSLFVVDFIFGGINFEPAGMTLVLEIGAFSGLVCWFIAVWRNSEVGTE